MSERGTATERERSRATAVWLFAVATLVFGMVFVGGATRLTGSGLSITQWKPISGALPPLSEAAWSAEFRHYQQIPQYRLVNAGMTLSEFKPLFWWEWAHRLLGRLVGLVFFVPLVALVALRRLPRRLLGRCLAILALGGLQGAVGWWMVASGLTQRTAVAPERLATHLGLALVCFVLCVWTGLEAWFGPAHPGPRADAGWRAAASGLAALVFAQSLLGALVAGNKAGMVDTDWPLMGGRWFPDDYAGSSLWSTLAHSLPAVQFNHRLGAYTLFVLALAFAAAALRSRRLERPVQALAVAVAAVVMLQATLGVVTLRSGAVLGLSLAHQLGAVVLLTTATALAWRMQRASSEPASSRSQVQAKLELGSRVHATV